MRRRAARARRERPKAARLDVLQGAAGIPAHRSTPPRGRSTSCALALQEQGRIAQVRLSSPLAAPRRAACCHAGKSVGISDRAGSPIRGQLRNGMLQTSVRSFLSQSEVACSAALPPAVMNDLFAELERQALAKPWKREIRAWAVQAHAPRDLRYPHFKALYARPSPAPRASRGDDTGETKQASTICTEPGPSRASSRPRRTLEIVNGYRWQGRESTCHGWKLPSCPQKPDARPPRPHR